MQLEQRENKKWLISDSGDGPTVGGVTFRVGLLDEPPRALGIHQVAVWLLRLASNTPSETNLEVMPSSFGSGTLRTSFMFWGDERGIAYQFDRLLEAVVRPPLELLSDAIERSKVEHPFLNPATCTLLANRYGPKGPGLSALRPFYLDQVDADEVVSYIQTHFCNDAAMFWTNSDLLPALVPRSLPSGQSLSVPEIPVASTPSTYLTRSLDRVTYTGIVDSGPAGRIAGEIIGTRIHRRVMEMQALASQVSFAMTPVDMHRSMIVIEVLAGEKREIEVVDALCQTIDDLKTAGPRPEEILREQDNFFALLRSQPLTELLDLAAGEIITVGTSRWMDVLADVADGMPNDVVANVQTACRSAQIVADTKFANHHFMYPVRSADVFEPSGFARRYHDVLDRRSWFRIDGPYLSHLVKPSLWSLKANIEWVTDLRRAGVEVNWSNQTTTYLDDLGESTSIYWPRVKHANKLKQKIDAQTQDIVRIEAHSEDDMRAVQKRIHRTRQLGFVVNVIRLVLLVFLAIGLVSDLADLGSIHTTPSWMAIQTEIGQKVQLPNGATFQLFTVVLNDGRAQDPGFYEATGDFEACGGTLRGNDLADHERNYLDTKQFQLVMEDNTAVQAQFDPVVQLALLDSHLGTGDCRRGRLAFDYPSNRIPRALFMQNQADDSISWSLMVPKKA